jgi:hypothetical protein
VAGASAGVVAARPRFGGVGGGAASARRREEEGWPPQGRRGVAAAGKKRGQRRSRIRPPRGRRGVRGGAASSRIPPTGSTALSSQPSIHLCARCTSRSRRFASAPTAPTMEGRASPELQDHLVCRLAAPLAGGDRRTGSPALLTPRLAGSSYSASVPGRRRGVARAGEATLTPPTASAGAASIPQRARAGEVEGEAAKSSSDEIRWARELEVPARSGEGK